MIILNEKNKKTFLTGLSIILMVAIGLIFLKFSPWAVYDFRKTDKVNTPSIQTEFSNQKDKSSNGLDTNKTEKFNIESNLIFTEASSKETTFYKVGPTSEKAKLFSLPNMVSTNGEIKGSLSPNGKIITYIDTEYNLQSHDIESGKKALLKASVDFQENKPGHGIRDVIYFTDVYFSPDGQKLALKWGGWESSGVAIIDIDGKNFQPININCGSNDIAWSEDSKKIVVAGINNNMGGEPACLYIASTDNSNHGKQILPKNEGKEFPDEYKDVFGPQFSPDGSKVVFEYRYLDTEKDIGILGQKANKYLGIYMVNVDGTNFKQVGNNQSYSTHPIWKDNNTLIYGLSNFYVGGVNKGVYSIQADGGNNVGLISQKEFNYYETISISPDKKELVYRVGVKDRATEETKTGNLYIYNFETKDSQPLTTSVKGSFVGWMNK